MHQELEDLVIYLRITGDIKYFCNIEKFLEHIFIGKLSEDGILQWGYHSEYVFPNLYGMYITKKYPNHTYYVRFDKEKSIKNTGSNMFPKDIAPKQLVDIIIKNTPFEELTENTRTKIINYNNIKIHLDIQNKKIRNAYPII